VSEEKKKKGKRKTKAWSLQDKETPKLVFACRPPL
jgi:hypothetical protein